MLTIEFDTMPKTANCGNVNAPNLLWLYSFRLCLGNIHAYSSMEHCALECECVKTSEYSVHSKPVNVSVSVVWEKSRELIIHSSFFIPKTCWTQFHFLSISYFLSPSFLFIFPLDIPSLFSFSNPIITFSLSLSLGSTQLNLPLGSQ